MSRERYLLATRLGDPPGDEVGSRGHRWVEVASPARETTDLEGRIVKDRVRNIQERQTALTDSAPAILARGGCRKKDATGRFQSKNCRGWKARARSAIFVFVSTMSMDNKSKLD